MKQATLPAEVAGPVLVLADNGVIAAAAPRWAAAFEAAGKLHRVRLVDRGTEAEVAAVCAEAESLAATAILTVGSGSQVAIGQAVAGRLGIRLLTTDC